MGLPHRPHGQEVEELIEKLQSNQEEANRAFASTVCHEASVRLQVVCTDRDRVHQIGQLSPATLAYIGDAVYELYVRTRYLLPPKRLSAYHDSVVARVRAESQAACLQAIESFLTEQEREILRRGRNAATGKPRRLSPEQYQQATSLETLIGYLYLQDPQRLNELLERLVSD